MKNQNTFTATLVTPEDKDKIVDLRKRTGLTEKELMTLVINTALAHEDSIVSHAKTITEKQETEKAARKVQSYETQKVKMKEVREAVKAQRLAQKIAPAVVVATPEVSEAS